MVGVVGDLRVRVQPAQRGCGTSRLELHGVRGEEVCALQRRCDVQPGQDGDGGVGICRIEPENLARRADDGDQQDGRNRIQGAADSSQVGRVTDEVSLEPSSEGRGRSSQPRPEVPDRGRIAPHGREHHQVVDRRSVLGIRLQGPIEPGPGPLLPIVLTEHPAPVEVEVSELVPDFRPVRHRLHRPLPHFQQLLHRGVLGVCGARPTRQVQPVQ